MVLLLLLLLLWVLPLHTWLTWMLLIWIAHILLALRHDISSVIFVILVIGEQVCLRVNYRLNYHSSLFSFNVQHFYYDVHDFRDHRWESLEDLIYNAVSNELKL